MSRLRMVMLVAVAMLAFAGNSLLCRMALKHTAIDPAQVRRLAILISHPEKGSRTLIIDR